MKVQTLVLLLAMASCSRCGDANPDDCIYSNDDFSDGSVMCQMETKYECRRGKWINLKDQCYVNGVKVSEETVEVSRTMPHASRNSGMRG